MKMIFSWFYNDITFLLLQKDHVGFWTNYWKSIFFVFNELGGERYIFDEYTFLPCLKFYITDSYLKWFINMPYLFF